MGAEKIQDPLVVIAAMLDGDRALPLEAAAMLIGEAPGTFRQLAARPGFPKPAKNAKRLTWMRSELLEWWHRERDRQARVA